MMTPVAPTRTPQGAAVKTVLLAYIAAAAWVAWAQSESAWFLLHAFGAVSGACALAVAVSLSGQIGAVQRELHGPIADQSEEEW